MNIIDNHKNIFDKKCSSSYCGVPRGAIKEKEEKKNCKFVQLYVYYCIQIKKISIIPALGRVSPKLNVDVKNANGNVPIPKDMYEPSPNPNPENPKLVSGSDLCPAGRGGTLFLRNNNLFNFFFIQGEQI